MDQNSSCPMIIEENGECQKYIFIMYTCIIGPLCILGMIGNSLILWIFHFHVKSLVTSSKVLLQALAATDLILLFSMLPTFCLEPLLRYTGWLTAYTKYIYPYLYVYGYPVCSMAHTCSIWVTVLVGVSRYVAICKPFKFPGMFNEIKTKIYIIVTVTFAVIYNLPLFFDCKITIKPASSANETASVEISALIYSNQLYQWLYESVLYLVFIFVLPLTILVILCILVIKRLNGNYHPVKKQISRADAMENIVTKMLLTVIIVFVLCQMPAMINRLLYLVLEPKLWGCGESAYYFGHTCNMLIVIDACLTIVIYTALNKKFRYKLKGLYFKESVTTQEINRHVTS